MLKLYESIPGLAVLSLRTGSPIATIVSPLINPNNLYIEGWYVTDGRSKNPLILLSGAIRDVLPQGFVVNDHEDLSETEELVRLKEVMELKFELIGKRVNSQSGKNYGKINDFAMETSNFFVQKLYAGQSIVKNISGGTLSIDRSQIIEITNRRIIIEDPTVKSKAPVVSPSPAA
jgi:sporulation protein YlmC with PRC-barrel domain